MKWPRVAWRDPITKSERPRRAASTSEVVEMELAFLRFFESLPAALAVGLLLLPRLIDEDGARFKVVIALFASVRAILGFFLIAAIAREIIPAERAIDYATLVTFCSATVVGKAWIVTQLIALSFAALTIARLVVRSDLLDKAALGAGALVLAVTSVTGHAIDDSFTLFTQASFLVHTCAGLTWIGGLLGLVYWMFTGRNKPPEVAAKLAERWSLIAKIAIALVVASGVAIAWENVGSFANLLATPYGRWLTVKLALFCAAMLAALALALYINHRRACAYAALKGNTDAPISNRCRSFTPPLFEGAFVSSITSCHGALPFSFLTPLSSNRARPSDISPASPTLRGKHQASAHVFADAFAST